MTRNVYARVVVLPARSTALAVYVYVPTPLASPPESCPLHAAARPEVLSVAEQVGFGTLPRMYVAPLAMPPIARLGGVVSTLMTGDATVAMLPALSTAVPVTDWLPCALSVTGGEQEATPDSASEQLKVTVTGCLYQPFALGAAGESE